MHDHLKTALITGATKGIGLAIADAFVQHGYRVIGISRHESKNFKQLGKHATWMKADVTDVQQVNKVIKDIAKNNITVNVLINGAGYSRWRTIETIDDKFLEMMLAVNLKSVFYMTRAAINVLAPQASIINIASLAGRRGSANNSAYCAAKFGVIGLTQSLAKELGPTGIRVNGVCPVYVLTEGVIDALREKASPAGKQSVAAYLTKFTHTQTALQRLPTAGDVAQTCLFLASEAASAITGQHLNVDCGVLPQ